MHGVMKTALCSCLLSPRLSSRRNYNQPVPGWKEPLNISCLFHIKEMRIKRTDPENCTRKGPTGLESKSYENTYMPFVVPSLN